MINFVTGNLFESGADCLINTVNCEGFMGKGIAYQFKLKFPQIKIFIKNNNPKTIAIPPLGCGNGGLEWYIVKNLIVERLEDIENNYNILIFEPSKIYTVKPQKAPNVSVSGLVVLQIVKEI